MMKKNVCQLLCFALCATQSFSLFAQTIAEKKESFQRNDNEMDQNTLAQLREVNQLLEEKRFELSQLYEQARHLYRTGAHSENYEPLLALIKQIKGEIADIQHMWRAETASLIQNEDY